MNWYFICWSFIVPEPLRLSLVDHFKKNEIPEDWEEVPVSPAVDGQIRHVIDYPGICSSKRTLQDITLDGLTFQIPSTDFSSMFQEIGSLPLQTEGGIPHYRLYGSVRCLVFTIEQREVLIREMGKQLPLAKEIGDWENRQLNAAFGGLTVTAQVVSSGRKVHTKVLSEPLEHGLVLTPKPVIDRDIEEA